MGADIISSDFASPFESNESSAEYSIDKGKTLSGTPRPPEIDDFSRLDALSNEGTTCLTYKWEWCSRVYFIKRLKPEFLHSPQHLHAFEKEFELGSRLSHPSLPRYIDFHHTQQECYIVMEYIDGKTLTELWHKPITASRIVTYRILNQLIDVIEYLHRNNVMHYDLLPQNVMLTKGVNNVMLIDLDKAFNSAYAKNHGNPSRFGLKASNEISSDVDFRGISIILSKGLWGGMHFGELKHFHDLCKKPGITAEELREALTHKFNDVYIEEKKCIEGRTCDGYNGDWQLSPVMIKRLRPALLDNKFYLDRFKEEFRIMNDCDDPTFAHYRLIRDTRDDCFIVIDKPNGMLLTEMIAEKHPWIYDSNNQKKLLRTLLSSFFYLWEEGLDNMEFESEDIFINPYSSEISIVNLREILNVTISDTSKRWTTTDVKTLSPSGKVLCKESIPIPDSGRPVEFSELFQIIQHMEERGVDMSWAYNFKNACLDGATYRELSEILENSLPH